MPSISGATGPNNDSSAIAKENKLPDPKQPMKLDQGQLATATAPRNDQATQMLDQQSVAQAFYRSLQAQGHSTSHATSIEASP